MLPVKHVRGYGYVTQTADTVITRLIEPVNGLTPVVVSVDYEMGADVHSLTFLKSVWETTLSAAALASATEIVLAEDNGTGSAIGVPASGDFCCIEHSDGSVEFNTISDWTAETKTATVTALAKACSAGSRVWVFGAAADHSSSRVIKPVASVRAKISNEFGGLASGERAGTPMLVHSTNNDTQGYIHHIGVAYCDFGRK